MTHELQPVCHGQDTMGQAAAGGCALGALACTSMTAHWELLVRWLLPSFAAGSISAASAAAISASDDGALSNVQIRCCLRSLSSGPDAV
jgi:hypothetical protein